MNRFMRFVPVLLLALVWAGCDSIGDENSGRVTLSGRVLDADTAQPIEDAFVQLVDVDPTLIDGDGTVRTDSVGRFELRLDVRDPLSVVIRASKTGYTSDSETAFASAAADQPILVPELLLQWQDSEVPRESGTPSNIQLGEVSSPVLGVRESGSVEVSRITFVVTDSAGTPIRLDDQVPVRFSLGSSPGEGAFISPQEALTDNQGRVTVNLSSGTKAGVVQVVAEASARDGSLIVSKPVTVTIHGGLPIENAFTIGPATSYNFAGLNYANVKHPIVVLLGDKYSNPVKPGTAVYFDTNSGLVEGSVFTNESGSGTTNYISGRPYPADGVSTVKAYTVNEDNQEISVRMPLLLSGSAVPVIETAEGDGVVSLGETIIVTLEDQLGNPLAPGTTISASANGTRVTMDDGAADVPDTGFLPLPDGQEEWTQAQVIKGPGYTQFFFTPIVDDDISRTGSPELISVTIRISGPNVQGGSLKLNVPADSGAGKTAAQIEAETDGWHAEPAGNGTRFVYRD